jgi:hypothetical protein
MESRDVMNIHVVEHSILNGIEYCTFWFRSVAEMTRHQLLLHSETRKSKRTIKFVDLGYTEVWCTLPLRLREPVQGA